jgi:hypothetical protein
MTREPSSPLLWAVTGGLLANLIAPVYSEPCFNVALAGEVTSGLARKLCQQLGCQHAYLEESDDTVVNNHRFPVVVTRRGVSDNYLNWLSDDSHSNHITEVNEQQGQVLKLQKNWLVVTPGGFMRYDVWEDPYKIVPAYLLYLTGVKFKLPDAPTLYERVILSIADWFAELGGFVDPRLVMSMVK